MKRDPRIGLRRLDPEHVEPVRVALVQPRPRGLRERGVGRLADEAVAEAQPAVLPTDEQVAADEPVERPVELGPGDSSCQHVHGRGRERVARDGAERQRRALGGVEPVETRREQRVQGGQRVGRPLVEVGGELLEERRVGAGRSELRRR